MAVWEWPLTFIYGKDIYLKPTNATAACIHPARVPKLCLPFNKRLIQNRRLMSSDSEVQCQSDDCMELFSPRRVAGHVEKEVDWPHSVLTWHLAVELALGETCDLGKTDHGSSMKLKKAALVASG